MLKYYSNENELLFILNNIRNEDKEELIEQYGKNWLIKYFNELKNSKILILYGKDYQGKQIPIAMGGFETLKTNSSIAVVWLICSSFININKNLLWKNLKLQMKKSERKYAVIYNFIYKSNFKAKNWLKRLGFSFDNVKPSGINIPANFEFFYKINKKGL